MTLLMLYCNCSDKLLIDFGSKLPEKSVNKHQLNIKSVKKNQASKDIWLEKGHDFD